MNEVESHSPNDHSGGRGGRPVSKVYAETTSLSVSPAMMQYESFSPATENCAHSATSLPISNDTQHEDAIVL